MLVQDDNQRPRPTTTCGGTTRFGALHQHDHLFIIIILSLLLSISHLSCQTTTTTTTTTTTATSATAANSGPEVRDRNSWSNNEALDAASSSIDPPCNQRQSRLESGVGRQRSLRYQDDNRLNHNQQQQQQHQKQQQNRYQMRNDQQTLRKQRQFGQPQARSAAMMLEAPQGAGLHAASEEFSLSSHSSNGGSVLVGNQVEHDRGAQNGTSYMMLAAESTAQLPLAEQNSAGSTPVATTTSGSLMVPGTGAVSTAPAVVGSGSSVASTTEQAAPSTTPMLASETISSPEVSQPPATTTSSTSGANLAAKQQEPQQQQQQQQRQQARRIEETSALSVDRHASQPSADDSPARQTSLFNGRSSISSMPSSTTIITPLMGPPTNNQQQQQHQPAATENQQIGMATSAGHISSSTVSSSSSSSSSMVKPIYVVGNPIGELDYSGTTTYSEQVAPASSKHRTSAPEATTNKQPSQVNTAQSSMHLQKAEKRLDLSVTTPNGLSLEEQQQQATTSDSRLSTSTNVSMVSHNPLADMGDNVDRMSGPALIYSDGQLITGSQLPATNNSAQQQPAAQPEAQGATLPNPSPRLFQGPGQSDLGTAAVLSSSQRRPSLPPPVNQANAASGLRSPLSPSGPLIGQPAAAPPPPVASQSLQHPANSQQQAQQQQPLQAQQMPNFYQTSPPYVGGAGANHPFANSQLAGNSGVSYPSMLSNKQAFILAAQQQQQQQQAAQQQQPPHVSTIASQFQLSMQHPQQPGSQQQQQQPQASITNQQQVMGPSRRPLNITRVEHISAECSNDLIRAVIVFNGTFKGIIYSSGYVNDPTCLYVNGTGTTRYEFSIRLNQCGTLGRQELHQPTIPGEARRRDQVMWNTLSIQYNPVIEQEWDEHFRVSCEYGSDFWKTISFSPFNVETSTGSPVVFTINPPQCQMDVLLGHGMGPKIAVDGPVTVGDPLTLLIHMKSEKAGYDILVKNCVAHNGGKQRMQLIDSNGCVVNERFISPFRGIYNDNDLRHVTLYAYLKAFRFTGSPVLYLECEIHMCQSACPPQMCYWRRLSKRSVDNNDFEYTDDRASLGNLTDSDLSDESAVAHKPVISDSLSLFKALQVRHEPIEPAKARLRSQQLQEIYAEDDEAQLVCYRHAEVMVFMATTGALLLLVLTVAITCCLRIRKMSRSQFKHSRMQQQHSTTHSISPSLLSLDDTLTQGSSRPSMVEGGGHSLTSHHHRPLTSPTSFCQKYSPFEQHSPHLKMIGKQQVLAAGDRCFKTMSTVSQQTKLNSATSNSNHNETGSERAFHNSPRPNSMTNAANLHGSNR